MALKPYMTSRDLINSVKRRIMFPLSQNTMSESDVLAFANEEMMISQVPGVISFHEEYFVFTKNLPLVSNIARYSIPDRAIGMRLRDVMWADGSGNLYEMTRVSADDKAFYNRNIGSNQAIAKYYLQGNEVILTPGVINPAPTGSLNMSFFLRPNQLVDNTRAAIIENFVKTIGVDSSELTVGDTIQVTLAQDTPSPTIELFTASQRAITSNSVANPTVVTTTIAHGQQIGSTFSVTISEVSGSTPTINDTYTATATGTSTFTVPVNVTVGGSGGFFALANEFTIGSTDIQTADNLAIAIGDTISSVTANNNSSATVTLSYSDITLQTTVDTANDDALSVDEDNVYINFDQLPTTWTDQFTGVTEDLYENGSLIDFLQTQPGHRTYTYDIELVSISGTIGKFAVTDLQYYASTGNGQVLKFLPILIGDYICLQNECIIPQIPPDLHTGLAERTSARILAAIGDQQGLDRINAKIAEIDGRQGTLLDSRVEGSCEKITARHSLLRYGKFRSRRRV